MKLEKNWGNNYKKHLKQYYLTWKWKATIIFQRHLCCVVESNNAVVSALDIMARVNLYILVNLLCQLPLSPDMEPVPALSCWVYVGKVYWSSLKQVNDHVPCCPVLNNYSPSFKWMVIKQRSYILKKMHFEKHFGCLVNIYQWDHSQISFNASNHLIHHMKQNWSDSIIQSLNTELFNSAKNHCPGPTSPTY